LLFFMWHLYSYFLNLQDKNENIFLVSLCI
jgi:hypothetical protein